ncbi:hypothetical protein Btru_044588 [Bulinus truncatus]|nr:hypothetical protein Btru_044588 [Bulinus truncatus]
MANNNGHNSDRPNLLHNLLSDKALDDDSVSQILESLFIGGTDSTAGSLTALFYNLARNPDKQEKLASEVRRFIGRTGEVTPEILNQMHYLKACLKESFRLHYPVSAVFRVLQTDITVSGYHVPAGVQIFLVNALTCEHKFENPGGFIPERWLRSANGRLEDQIPKNAVLPFGMGPRNCVGRRFAEQEINLATIKVLQKLKIGLADQSRDAEFVYRIFLQPSNPIHFVFTERKLEDMNVILDPYELIALIFKHNHINFKYDCTLHKTEQTRANYDKWVNVSDQTNYDKWVNVSDQTNYDKWVNVSDQTNYDKWVNVSDQTNYDKPMCPCVRRRCDSHKEQVINFYCKKCHVAICHVCTVVTHRQHDGHRIFELNNLMKLYEQKFQRRREIHREILQGLDACLQQYDVICKLPSMKENLQKLIKRDLERNIKTLKVRSDYLCGRIAETYDQQSAQLTSNKIILTELKNKLDSQISEFDNAKAKPDVVTSLELYRKMKKEADKNKEMISEGSAAAKLDQLKVVFEEDATFQNKL